MRRGYRLLLAVGMIGANAVATSAALPPQHPQWDATSTDVQMRSRAIVASFAECATNAEWDRSVKLLATVPASTEEQAIFREITDKAQDCLRSIHDMRMIGGTFRGTIAEDVYKRRAKYLDPMTPRLMTLDYRQFAEHLTAANEGRGRMLSDAVTAAYWLGYCTAHRDPAAVEQLLRSWPDSTRETKVLHDLSPTLSDCASQGRAVGLGRVTLRAFLAEGLYRLRFNVGEQS